MAIKQYSLAKDGARQLSPAFKVREFRCRDGSDAIMVDEALTAHRFETIKTKMRRKEETT